MRRSVVALAGLALARLALADPVAGLVDADDGYTPDLGDQFNYTLVAKEPYGDSTARVFDVDLAGAAGWGRSRVLMFQREDIQSQIFASGALVSYLYLAHVGFGFALKESGGTASNERLTADNSETCGSSAEESLCSDSTVQVLALGLGGGAYPNFLQRNYGSRVNVTVVELSQDVIRIAKMYFGVKESPLLRIVHADARDFVQSTQHRFDFILHDACSSQGNVPELFTANFFSALANIVKSNGVLVVNVITGMNHEKPTSLSYSAHRSDSYSVVRQVFKSVFILELHDMQALFICLLQPGIGVDSLLQAAADIAPVDPPMSFSDLAQTTLLEDPSKSHTTNLSPVKVVFHNRGNRILSLWYDALLSKSSCSPSTVYPLVSHVDSIKAFEPLMPGVSQTHNSFVTHTFVVLDSDNRVVQCVIVEPGEKNVVDLT